MTRMHWIPDILYIIRLTPWSRQAITPNNHTGSARNSYSKAHIISYGDGNIVNDLLFDATDNFYCNNRSKLGVLSFGFVCIFKRSP